MNAYDHDSDLVSTEAGLIAALDYSNDEILKILQLVESAATTNSPTFLNLDKCQKSINLYFESIRLKLRFNKIRNQYPSLQINSNVEHFIVLTHKFSTLDELEHALKNQAFL